MPSSPSRKREQGCGPDSTMSNDTVRREMSECSTTRRATWQRCLSCFPTMLAIGGTRAGARDHDWLAEPATRDSIRGLLRFANGTERRHWSSICRSIAIQHNDVPTYSSDDPSVMPPSQMRVWPVTRSDPSMKPKIASATSSGSQTLPSGTRLSTAVLTRS